MFRKLFIVSLIAASSVHGGPIKEDGSTIGQKLQVQADNAENYVFEDQLLDILEILRKLMKTGDPENGIPVMEPLRIEKLFFDLYLEDTELKGHFMDTIIAHLSDFQMKNLSLTVSPAMELKLKVLFERLDLSGYYDLFGTLFDELPIDGRGTYRVHLENLTLSAEGLFRSKAGILQVKNLNATFDLDHVSVAYKNLKESEDETVLAEDFVLSILHRVRALYLPLLLNTLKIVVNDFIQRWKDRQELTAEMLKIIS